VSDLAAAVREVAGEADLEVRGGRAGFPEALYPRIARVEGVARASPGLELAAGIAGTEHTIDVIGIDVLREAARRLPLDRAERLELLQPDRVLLSSAAAQRLGLRTGSRLRLLVGQKIVALQVIGVVPVRGFAALTDLSTAQWRLGRLGELNRLELRVARGADREAVRERIAALLPPGVHVSSVEKLEQASGYPSRAYRVNLDVLAMVALFTGGFLVFSAQTLEAARRRREHALLRTLGLRAGELARLVLLEAAAGGVLGSLLGIALGYALARTALALLGADLGAGAFRAVFPQADFSLLAASAYFAAGVAVALLGALLPALDASRAAPAPALKAGDEQAMFARMSPAWPGIALVISGLGLAQLGPVRGLPLFGYASIACLLLGSIALMPRVSQIVFRALPGSRSLSLTLALAQLRGAPGQAGVSLAAIVASFSLMVAMAIMVASFRDSVAHWLEAVLPADLYLRTRFAGDTGHLEPGFEARVRGLPEVARAEFLRSGRILLDPSRPAVSLIARYHAADAFPGVGEVHEVRAGEPPAVWISEAVSDLYGFQVGQVVQLPIEGRALRFTVAGLFRD
jgi:putative ABC transport system permease protein